MNHLIQTWDQGRLTVAGNGGIRVDHARIGVCLDGQWRFPFESQTIVESQTDWLDNAGAGVRHTVAATDSVRGLAAQYHCVIYRDRPMARLWCTLRNASNHGIELDAIHLLETAVVEGGALTLPCAAEDMMVFTDSGSCHFSGVCSLLGESPEYDEKWLNFCPSQSRERMIGLTGREALGAADHASPSGLAVFAGDAAALLIGFLPLQRALSTVICRGSEAGTEYLAASSGLFGYELPPDAEYVSEELLIAVCDDGLTALRTYAQTAAVLREIYITRPADAVPSGWISWYGYRLDLTEEDVLANACIIKDRFLDYGMDVIQPDFGWQQAWCATEWRKTNDNFPHGLEWLADQVQQMGLRMGFWGSPVLVSTQSELYKQHPEFLLSDADGDAIDAGHWTWGARELMYILDPTVPAAMNAIAEEIKWLRETTNCHYWKFDFTVFLMALHKDPRFTDATMIAGIETYRHAIRELRRAVEDDYLYFCTNFPFAEWGIGDTMMTAPDIGNPCFEAGHHADQTVYQTEHFRKNATTILSRHFLHRRLTLLNSDTANLGAGSLREARMRLSLVAFSGGQFFLGDALPDYSEDRLDMAEKGLPIYGEAATPLDLFAQPYPSHPRIWHLPIAKPWDHWDVVCLANINDSESITIDLQAAFPDHKDALLFDFWDETPLGTLNQHPTFTLEATESRILCLRTPGSHPHLVATNMHVTQGGVEVIHHQWTDATRTLQIDFRRRPDARGKFWIHIPPGFAANFTLDSRGGNAEVLSSTATSACVTLEFEAREVMCELCFE